MEGFLKALANYSWTDPPVSEDLLGHPQQEDKDYEVFREMCQVSIGLRVKKELMSAVAEYWTKFGGGVYGPLFLSSVVGDEFEALIKSSPVTLYSFSTVWMDKVHPATLWEICDLNGIPYPEDKVKEFTLKHLEIKYQTGLRYYEEKYHKQQELVEKYQKIADQIVSSRLFLGGESNRRFWRIIFAVILYELRLAKAAVLGMRSAARDF